MLGIICNAIGVSVADSAPNAHGSPGDPIPGLSSNHRPAYCYALMDDRIARLAEKAKSLPKSPGVYLMKDDKGRVIYVGKSASLRDRVGSYFLASAKLEFKKAGLLDDIIDFDTIETDSEVEALLAENRLIKDIQPKYNARLLDDKTFPYLMVTTDEEFPGVYVTREPRTKGVKLYGPFTSVHSLKEAVTMLQ